MTLNKPTLNRVPVGATVRLACRACRVGQTLTAQNTRVPLKKLNGRRLRKGASFTITITKVGYIGQVVTRTVRRYGRSSADLKRAAKDPFKERRRCIPIGSDKPATLCPAIPPTGP